MAASLTHSFDNGLQRWPDELSTLIAMGHSNLDAIEDTINRYKIDCDYIRSGEVTMVTEPYQISNLLEELELSAHYGEKTHWLGQDSARATVNSPLYILSIYIHLNFFFFFD